MRVLVPLGKKKIVTGIVLSVRQGEEEQQTYREVIRFQDPYPIITAEQLRLWNWMSAYYMCSLGEVMRAALPAALKPEGDEERYTPKMKTYISLGEVPPAGGTKGKLLTEKQQQLLRIFLGYEAEKVGQAELLEAAGVSTAVLEGLLKRGVLQKTMEEESRLQKRGCKTREAYALTEEQERAAQAIRNAWKTTPTVLLHGVTSSGKTEVYIRLIQEQIESGKQVLYLVPEIALTTQLTDRLQAVFGDRMAVYHSRFSDNERAEIYQNMLRGGQYDVVIGVRSSLFLPFRNLGLIIVDEEHDASYKQQDPAPRYHARTTAQMLASLHGAKVLLGTATPAVETYYNALQGKYGLAEMPNRFAGLSLPAIHLMDLKKAYAHKAMTGHFSDPLVFRIREQLDAGKQVLLFQNHRGYNAYVECRACGYVPKCAHCDISLTEHRSVVPGMANRLVCHYCGYSTPLPSACPTCGQDQLADRGFGTEKLEEEAKALFPEARVARMDADTTVSKHAHEKLIRQFANHEIDILVGTQMITKGLHFKDVSLVAVLKADSILNIPDFRACERGYQMLEQVAGRAGRAGEPGHVILQTTDTENPVFRHLKQHDYRAMYEEQVAQREIFRYPPFHRIICVTLRHRESSRLETASRTLCERLKQVFGTRCSDVIVPAVSRAQGYYIRQLMLKIEAAAPYAKAKEMLGQEIAQVLTLQGCKGTVITPDVDPM